MNPSYFTLKHDAQVEITVQRSRFICVAKKADNEEEAIYLLQQIQKKYWDATHNCYAYRISDHVQKASDDGEPSGTAGQPILNVITKNELLHTLIVITRYFGGIKLGGGGLIRAYSQGASEALLEAGIVKMSLHQALHLSFEYAHLSKLEYELRRTPCYVEAIQFKEIPTRTIWVPLSLTESLQQQINTWTNGKVTIHIGEKKYRESRE